MNPSDPSTPELGEVVETIVAAHLARVHTAIPGRIVTYDGHDKRTATVKPSVRLPTPAGVFLDIPPIDNVPVVFPSCAFGSLVFPLKPGDGVLIVYAEVGIGKFLGSKATDTVDPDDNSRFTLTDAVAIPGLMSQPTIPTLPSLSEDGIAVVTASGAVVELGKKVGVRNSDGDLRTEIEKLWQVIADGFGDLGTQLQALYSTASTATSPGTPPSALAPGIKLAADSATATKGTATSGKSSPGKVLA